jgi:predicted transglutaminase-like cysteine proteinase
MQRHSFYAACAALAAAALPTGAQAATLGSLPLALAAAASLEQGQCARAALPATGETRTAPAVAMSKASAILGGQVSRLELMRQEQAGIAAPALPGAGLVPRSGGECALFVRPQSDLTAMRPGAGVDKRGSEDFLASKRLAVSRTGFDAQWERVRKGRVEVKGFAAETPGRATLAAINSWANARIRYVEDRALYGKADYWADAPTTLKRGAGDCEDIAVVKLALLVGAGVRRDDIYLTVARDLARNADHALLVVKAEGRYWLLDNNTDRLLDAAEAHDYRPILSYSAKGKWLHGY